MNGTQVNRPSNPGQGGRFPRISRTGSRSEAKQQWPTRTGFQVLGRRHTALSDRHGANKREEVLDSDRRRPTALKRFFSSFRLERCFTIVGILVVNTYLTNSLLA
jgi:hypothetical protein